METISSIIKNNSVDEVKSQSTNFHELNEMISSNIPFAKGQIRCKNILKFNFAKGMKDDNCKSGNKKSESSSKICEDMTTNLNQPSISKICTVVNPELRKLLTTTDQIVTQLSTGKVLLRKVEMGKLLRKGSVNFQASKKCTDDVQNVVSNKIQPESLIVLKCNSGCVNQVTKKTATVSKSQSNLVSGKATQNKQLLFNKKSKSIEQTHLIEGINSSLIDKNHGRSISVDQKGSIPNGARTSCGKVSRQPIRLQVPVSTSVSVPSIALKENLLCESGKSKKGSKKLSFGSVSEFSSQNQLSHDNMDNISITYALKNAEISSDSTKSCAIDKSVSVSKSTIKDISHLDSTSFNVLEKSKKNSSSVSLTSIQKMVQKKANSTQNDKQTVENSSNVNLKKDLTGKNINDINFPSQQSKILKKSNDLHTELGVKNHSIEGNQESVQTTPNCVLTKRKSSSDMIDIGKKFKKNKLMVINEKKIKVLNTSEDHSVRPTESQGKVNASIKSSLIPEQPVKSVTNISPQLTTSTMNVDTLSSACKFTVVTGNKSLKISPKVMESPRTSSKVISSPLENKSDKRDMTENSHLILQHNKVAVPKNNTLGAEKICFPSNEAIEETISKNSKKPGIVEAAANANSSKMSGLISPQPEESSKLEFPIHVKSSCDDVSEKICDMIKNNTEIFVKRQKTSNSEKKCLSVIEPTSFYSCESSGSKYPDQMQSFDEKEIEKVKGMLTNNSAIMKSKDITVVSSNSNQRLPLTKEVIKLTPDQIKLFGLPNVFSTLKDLTVIKLKKSEIYKPIKTVLSEHEQISSKNKSEDLSIKATNSSVVSQSNGRSTSDSRQTNLTTNWTVTALPREIIKKSVCSNNSISIGETIEQNKSQNLKIIKEKFSDQELSLDENSSGKVDVKTINRLSMSKPKELLASGNKGKPLMICLSNKKMEELGLTKDLASSSNCSIVLENNTSQAQKLLKLKLSDQLQNLHKDTSKSADKINIQPSNRKCVTLSPKQLKVLGFTKNKLSIDENLKNDSPLLSKKIQNSQLTGKTITSQNQLKNHACTPKERRNVYIVKKTVNNTTVSFNLNEEQFRKFKASNKINTDCYLASPKQPSSPVCVPNSEDRPHRSKEHDTDDWSSKVKIECVFSLSNDVAHHENLFEPEVIIKVENKVVSPKCLKRNRLNFKRKNGRKFRSLTNKKFRSQFYDEKYQNQNSFESCDYEKCKNILKRHNLVLPKSFSPAMVCHMMSCFVILDDLFNG